MSLRARLLVKTNESLTSGRYASEHQHKLLGAKQLVSRKVIESAFPQITLIQCHGSLDLPV
jgi:hypothetical protein